jgi:signal transduction histidine kinase
MVLWRFFDRLISAWIPLRGAAAVCTYDIAVLVLHVLQGPDRGKRFELPAHEPQLIGRSTEALPLSDQTVSRRHAELTPDDGRWFIRDLDSSNGTWVNGQRVQDRVELTPGDQVRCGSTLFVFGLAGEPRGGPSAVQMVDPAAMDITVAGAIPSGDGAIRERGSEALRAALDHLRIIYQLTAVTASTFDQHELLDRIMDLIVEEFRPDRGFILLMSDASSPPEPAVVRYRTRPRSADEGRIPVSRTIIQHALQHGEGILSTNAMSDPRFSAGDSVRAYGIRSAICVPIRAGDRTFGVIHIDSAMLHAMFTESQLRLLNVIAQHTALALLSAEAVHQTMQRERLAAMGQTVASLSHSIKNILQGLRSGADAIELALNRGDLALAREGWPILARNLDRIYALTLNMLLFAKPRDLEIDLAPLSRLVQEAAELIQPQCDRRQVALVLELDEDMPPIPLDAHAMHQALMNLLTNAVEAVPAKKGIITIRTRFDAAAHEAAIVVADNGPGIEPRLQEHIFEAFTSSKGQRGTGLGLAVTRKIVDQHGGRILLESRPGLGATFTVMLPTDRAALDSGDTRAPRPQASVELTEEF